MGCSIVVCTEGKKSDLLVRCIQSLLNQTYEEVEVICVSTVGSLPEEVESNTRVIVEKKRGVSFAKNLGIRESRHEFVALTDDDCICSPDWVKKLVCEFDEERVGCVTGGSVPTRKGLWYASTNWKPEKQIYQESGGFIPPWTMGAGNNICLRKKAIMEIGYFDEELGPGSRFRGAEDIDVFHRMISAGYLLVYTPDAVVEHEPLDTHIQVKEMMYNYRFGIGAFFAKHRDNQSARKYFRKNFLRRQLLDSKNNFARGNLAMGWAYLMGYLAANRGYLEYILVH